MQSENSTIAALFAALSDAVPGFKAILAEHMDEFDEMLPHVLMGALVQDLEERASREDFMPAFTALEIIERIFLAGDPDAQELISVSFLENLEPGNTLYGELRKRMGPALLAELATYEALL